MITGVAIRTPDRVLYTLEKPKRHHDLIRQLVETGVVDWVPSEWEQGFIDDKNQFYRRKPALIHAQKCKQLLPRATCNGGNLFSEDVW